MFAIKILFAVCMVINFFVVILDEKASNHKIAFTVATFFLFIIMVVNHAFF